MNNEILIGLIAFVVFVMAYYIYMIKVFYKKVDSGRALIRYGRDGRKISYNGILVFPLLHQIEIVDITLKKLYIQTTMKDLDLKNVELNISLLTRLDTSSDEKFLETIEKFGAANVSEANFLHGFFNEKTIESVQRVVREYSFKEIAHCVEDIKNGAIRNLEPQIPGFIVEDLIITVA